MHLVCIILCLNTKQGYFSKASPSFSDDLWTYEEFMAEVWGIESKPKPRELGSTQGFCVWERLRVGILLYRLKEKSFLKTFSQKGYRAFVKKKKKNYIHKITFFYWRISEAHFTFNNSNEIKHTENLLSSIHLDLCLRNIIWGQMTR